MNMAVREDLFHLSDLKKNECVEKYIIVTTPKCEISEKHVLWKFRGSIRTGGKSKTDCRFQQQLGERT
jgi:hypothetical protein